VTRRFSFLSIVLIFIVAHPAAAQIADVIRGGGLQSSAKTKQAEVKSDAKTLGAVGLKPDEPAALLKYLKQRTLSDSEL